jgi:hypothetical protein
LFSIEISKGDVQAEGYGRSSLEHYWDSERHEDVSGWAKGLTRSFENSFRLRLPGTGQGWRG